MASYKNHNTIARNSSPSHMAARVRIPDLRGEEFEEAIGSARRRRRESRGTVSEWDKLVHSCRLLSVFGAKWSFG